MEDQANSNAKNKGLLDISAINTQLSEKIAELFDLVVSDRSHHFEANPNQIPDKKAVPDIISYYSKLNAVISGGSSLIPGPWGMLAALPEIAAVIRNQLAMVYDIGMAYNKKKVLTKELLAGVLLTAFGSSTSTLFVMHGSKVLVKRVALRFFQQIIGILGGKITQQLLKSTISKWLPLVGPVAMAAWSGYLTQQIGKKAIELFEKEIDISDVIEEASGENQTVESLVATGLSQNIATKPLEAQKIKVLINLMSIDGTAEENEKTYINQMLDQSNLNQEEKAALLESTQKSEKLALDFSDFKNSPDDAIGLLVDMVALAKRDGQFHVTEKMLIKKTGATLGFSESDVEEMMSSAA
jgi:uncharacterized tellurite resistance protein B-like protein